MITDLDQLADELKNGDNPRDLMIEIISNGAFFPPMVKALAYVAVMQMDNEKLNTFRGYALEAIEYAKNKDLDGLENFLVTKGVPAPMVALIKPYVNQSKD